MMKVHRPSLSILRGLAGAAIAATVAGALVALLSAGLLAFQWAGTGASAYDFPIARDQLPLQALGCAVVAGCAGWAAFAPSGRARLALTLTVVFAGSVALWTVAGALDLLPRRFKSVRHPLLYPSEALFLFGPPVLMAGFMALLRVHQSKHKGSEVSAASNPGRT